MPRGVHSDSTDFYRARITRAGTGWTSYYGPYNLPSVAKAIITRESRWSANKGASTSVQKLVPKLEEDGKLTLVWEDMDGQLSFDDAL